MTATYLLALSALLHGSLGAPIKHPLCEIPEGPNQPLVSHDSKWAVHDEAGVPHYFKKVWLSCPEGKRLLGPETVVCENGNWNVRRFPQCRVPTPQAEVETVQNLAGRRRRPMRGFFRPAGGRIRHRPAKMMLRSTTTTEPTTTTKRTRPPCPWAALTTVFDTLFRPTRPETPEPEPETTTTELPPCYTEAQEQVTEEITTTTTTTEEPTTTVTEIPPCYTEAQEEVTEEITTTTTEEPTEEPTDLPPCYTEAQEQVTEEITTTTTTEEPATTTEEIPPCYTEAQEQVTEEVTTTTTTEEPSTEETELPPCLTDAAQNQEDPTTTTTEAPAEEEPCYYDGDYEEEYDNQDVGMSAWYWYYSDDNVAK